WSMNSVPLLTPPKLLVAGERDTRCGCWGGGGGGGGGGGPRLPVLVSVLDCNKKKRSEARPRFAIDEPVLGGVDRRLMLAHIKLPCTLLFRQTQEDTNSTQLTHH